MTKITITGQDKLSSGEFLSLLEQTEKQSSTTQDLLGLLRQLVAFEQSYKMASDVFYARFMRGELGDSMPFMKWAGRYELYLEVKQAIDQHVAQLGMAA